MPESPRPNQDPEEAAANVDATPATTSALHSNTRVVRFDDFQSNFFPSRPVPGRGEADRSPRDGSEP